RLIIVRKIFGNHDFLVVGWQRLRGVVKKFLIKFLARAQPDDFDLDVFFRNVTGKADHFTRKVDNLDRLAHIEDKNLSSTTHSSGFENELTRLWNSHKIADDIRMRQCNGPALLNLFGE